MSKVIWPPAGSKDAFAAVGSWLDKDFSLSYYTGPPVVYL